MRWKFSRRIVATIYCGLICGFFQPTIAQAEPRSFMLASADFAPGAPIPAADTCVGQNRSPELKWRGAPAGVKSFALLVTDPDAPMGVYKHWVVYNLPPSADRLPADLPATPTIAGGGVQGTNERGTLGYHGPCPPPGPAHHYHFRLYALDAMLALKPGATADQVTAAMHGHALAATDLVGTFGR